MSTPLTGSKSVSHFVTNPLFHFDLFGWWSQKSCRGYYRCFQNIVSSKELPDRLAGACCWFNYQTDTLVAFDTQQVLIWGLQWSWKEAERVKREWLRKRILFEAVCIIKKNLILNYVHVLVVKWSDLLLYEDVCLRMPINIIKRRFLHTRQSVCVNRCR